MAQDRFSYLFILLETAVLPLLDEIAAKIIKGKVYSSPGTKRLLEVCRKIVDHADKIFELAAQEEVTNDGQES